MRPPSGRSVTWAAAQPGDRGDHRRGAARRLRDADLYAMENIHAGTFWIDDPLTDNDAGAFGGMRLSGMGRELGIEGLDAFREPKHVHLDYRIEAKPYWYPYRWDHLKKDL